MDLTLIRDGMNAAVPFVRHVGLALETVEPGRATVRLPAHDQLHNHVGSQHAGALFTAGETASGGAVLGALAERIGQLRPLVRDASIAYKKVARGEILATGAVDTPVEAIIAALDADGRADFAVDVALTDVEGVVVAEMRVLWNVRMQAA